MSREPPLAGIKVLDMTRFIAGPYCTMLLADQGAEIVKLEPPGGEVTRSLHPMLGESEQDQVSAYFLRYNRGKKSICVDLKTDAGLRVVELLIRQADVLVENFRPGVLNRMGLSWTRLAELNERLIYCTITGFGHSDSPLRDRGAFTPIVEAMSASVTYRSRTDDSPSIAGYPVGDIFPASLAVAAIAMALYRRGRDGLGARIDMAMYDAMVSMNERAVGMSAMLGREQLPGIPADTGSSPAGVFAAKDGYITLAVVGEDLWQRFCAAIERPDWATDELLSSGVRRGAHYDTVVLPGIQQWLEGQTRAEAVQKLIEAGVPAAEVARPGEVVESEQARARDMIVSLPTYGDVVATVAGNPIHFGGESRPQPAAAPAAGEHTIEILRAWAGLDEHDIEQLVAHGTVTQRELAAKRVAR